MTIRGYETVLIARADMKDDSLGDFREKILQIIEREGGIVRGIEDWGKKRLAYEIRRHRKGNYILFNYTGEDGLTMELERNLKIDERSLKYMTIRIEDSLDDEAVEAAKEQHEELMKKLAVEAEKKAEAAAAPKPEPSAPAVTKTGPAKEKVEAAPVEPEKAVEAVEGGSEASEKTGEADEAAASEEEKSGEADSDASEPEAEAVEEEEETKE